MELAGVVVRECFMEEVTFGIGKPGSQILALYFELGNTINHSRETQAKSDVPELCQLGQVIECL